MFQSMAMKVKKVFYQLSDIRLVPCVSNSLQQNAFYFSIEEIMPIVEAEENIEEMKQSPQSLDHLVLLGCAMRLKKSIVIFIE